MLGKLKKHLDFNLRTEKFFNYTERNFGGAREAGWNGVQ